MPLDSTLVTATSHPKDPAELICALEDTQASLQAALARINVYAAKVKQLTKELTDARNALATAGVEEPAEGEERSPPPLPPKAPTGLASPASARNALRMISTSMRRSGSTGSMQRVSSSASLRGQLPTQQPVFVHHGDRKVKGFVFGREGCLEFYELVATITPSQFVGVAHVDDPNLRTQVDHAHLQADQGQQWFDLGWLFHPQDVISNLSSYLADTLAGDSPSSADDGEQETPTKWGDAQDVPPPPAPSSTVGEDEGGAQAQDDGDTGPRKRTDARTSDALDIGRWELPVGRKGGASETWELVWKQEEGSGKLQRLIIEGSVGACTMITRHIEAWHTLPPQPMGPAARSQPSSTRMGASTPQETASNERAPQQGEQGMDAPLHLVPGSVMPTLSEPSQLLEESQIRALVTALPTRYRLCNTWSLVYSTQRHGISLQTLYRRAQSVSPTLLVVRDSGGYLFGAYCSEPWHVAARYYGTGETFVFQLQPHMVAWHWHRRPDNVVNSFFMYACHDSIAVGGGTDFALWLDADLEHGHSGPCDTFGSPGLSSEEDFGVGHLELWAPQ